MAGQVSVGDCEDYIQKHGIQDILKNCISKICQERPAQPYMWFKEHFDKLDRVRASEERSEMTKCLSSILCHWVLEQYLVCILSFEDPFSFSLYVSAVTLLLTCRNILAFHPWTVTFPPSWWGSRETEGGQ